MSKVWLIEALARKQGAKELAEEPTDTGSKLNLSSILRLQRAQGNGQGGESALAGVF